MTKTVGKIEAIATYKGKKIQAGLDMFTCKIPNIILINFDCTDNCEYVSDDFENNPILIWKNGIRNLFLNESLELFSKTPEGQNALGLFLKKGASIFSFKAKEDGKYSDLHTLMFVESDYKGLFGNTSYKFKNRCPKYNTINVSDYAKMYLDDGYFKRKSKLDSLKTNYYKYYMLIQIYIYPNEFLVHKKEKKWSEARLKAQIAHTIAHELFIHAYRKGIPAMEAWKNKDFNKFSEIINRDTGEHGDFDHIAYIKNFKDEGIGLMKSFQKNLSKIIGSELFKEVKKYHDSTYLHLKNKNIPK